MPSERVYQTNAAYNIKMPKKQTGTSTEFSQTHHTTRNVTVTPNEAYNVTSSELLMMPCTTNKDNTSKHTMGSSVLVDKTRNDNSNDVNVTSNEAYGITSAESHYATLGPTDKEHTYNPTVGSSVLTDNENDTTVYYSYIRDEHCS